jgi:hypothetical protein
MYTDSPDRFVFNPHERISSNVSTGTRCQANTQLLREEPTRIAV